jgi:hypothetical protein
VTPEILKISRDRLHSLIWLHSRAGTASLLGIKTERLKLACAIFDIPVPSSAYFACRQFGHTDPLEKLPPTPVIGNEIEFRNGDLELPLPDGWNSDCDWQTLGMNEAHHTALLTRMRKVALELSKSQREQLRLAAENAKQHRQTLSISRKAEREARHEAELIVDKERNQRRLADIEAQDQQIFSMLSNGRTLAEMAAVWRVSLPTANKRFSMFLKRGNRVTGLPTSVIYDFLCPRERGKPDKFWRSRYSRACVTIDAILALRAWEDAAVSAETAVSYPLAELKSYLRKHGHKYS